MGAISFTKPAIGARERKAVYRALRSGWLTSGPICQKFEEEFAAACQARHAIAVSSATAGLHLALVSADCAAADVLCVSPYTFAASAAVALHLGMRVQFVDIEEGGYNIDCRLLEQTIKRIRAAAPPQRRIAIMAVHIGGAACDMPRIRAIANTYDCCIIEDAAHCQPLIGEGAAMGARGDYTVFSFYATKPLTTAEGGMIITNDGARAQRMRLLRNHGMSASLWERSGDRAYWQYDIQEHGYKYNLPDPLAAMGRVQLQRRTRHWQARMRIAAYYCRTLHDCVSLETPAAPKHLPARHHAWHLFLCQLHRSALRIDRNEWIARMSAEQIHCSVHYVPLHLTSAYMKAGYTEHDFPRATARYRNAVSLPLHPRMTLQTCQRVVRAINAIGRRYRPNSIAAQSPA